MLLRLGDIMNTSLILFHSISIQVTRFDVENFNVGLC